MPVQRTFAIIKPDAVAKPGATGEILRRIEDRGLAIVGLKRLHMTQQQAQGFYAVHSERPFFSSLIEFMTSGPVVLMTLRGENAIARWRDLMGPTDATQAGPDTVRGRFGTNIERNASHGSDATDTAAFETAHFFSCFDRIG